MEKYQKSALTVQEAAKELDVEVADIEQMIRESRLSHIPIGEKQRIPVVSLSKIIDEVKFDPAHYPNSKYLVNSILDEVLNNKKKSF